MHHVPTEPTRRSSRRAGAEVLFTTAVALFIALPLMIGACGAEEDGVQGPPPDERAVVMSDVSRLAATAPESDVQALTRSIELFGADLYGVLADRAGDGNVVFSPCSVATALAMTYAGAAGATAEEMAATLRLTLEGDTLHQAFNSLDAILESRNLQQKNAEGVEESVLLIAADGLWADRHWTFEQDFLDTLAAYYGAGVRLADLDDPEGEGEEARQAINDWVASETNDKIPELIPPGAFNRDKGTPVVLVLVDALYVGATWAEQFLPWMTSDGEFTTLAGRTVTAPLMHKIQFHPPYAQGDGWHAVELPYVGGRLAMLLIVPDEGRFADIEDRLDAGLISEVAGGLSEGPEISLTMPRFEFRWKDSLKEALTALGMGSAFDLTGAADFSGMRPAHDIWIDDVVHEAFIAVDEHGTEAAAATGVTIVASSNPDVVRLTIDRPFLFALRDRETGAILFLGRVADPTAG